MSDDRHNLALLLAHHQRLDAPGGKCSCGHETELGHLFSAHVAEAVLLGGWVSRSTVYKTATDRASEAEREAAHFQVVATRLKTERDALAATVQRVRALCDGPPMHPKAPLYVRISAVRAVLDERGDIKGFGDG